MIVLNHLMKDHFQPRNLNSKIFFHTDRLRAERVNLAEDRLELLQ